MSFKLFNKTPKVFGLDISGNSLKVFEFEKKGGATSIKSYTNAPLPKTLINADVITDHATFAHVLKAALEKPLFGRFDTVYAVANLPETKSFVRVIQIPKMSDAEAENAVPFEAESFIPLPIDQVYLDWQKLSESEDKMNILIIASPKDFVDSYLDVLEKSGIKPVALEVESQSCHRALIDPSLKETLLIVDMSANRTSLIMVEDGNLQFTSTIPFAGNSFTDSVAKSLGVSLAKAEIIKYKVGIDNTAEYPNIKTSLLPVLGNLSAEIKNILRFHGEHSDKKVNKIILTGGSARLKNLPEFLAAEFTDLPGMKVEIGNPWHTIANIHSAAMEDSESLQYTTAIGLAMRGGEA